MGDDFVRGRSSGRASQRSWAACCAVALAVSALVATSADDRAVATAGDPVTVSTTAELTAAVATGGVIYLAAPEFVVNSALEIRKTGTELRAVNPGEQHDPIPGFVRPSDRGLREERRDRRRESHRRQLPVRRRRRRHRGRAGASLTLSRSTITGNRDDFGGGILNEGTITIVDSTISDNVASHQGRRPAERGDRDGHQLHHRREHVVLGFRPWPASAPSTSTTRRSFATSRRRRPRRTAHCNA